jgi:hypothetical protein
MVSAFFISSCGQQKLGAADCRALVLGLKDTCFGTKGKGKNAKLTGGGQGGHKGKVESRGGGFGGCF